MDGEDDPMQHEQDSERATLESIDEDHPFDDDDAASAETQTRSTSENIGLGAGTSFDADTMADNPMHLSERESEGGRESEGERDTARGSWIRTKAGFGGKSTLTLSRHFKRGGSREHSGQI